MVTSALHQALTDCGPPLLRPLPADVAGLLEQLHAPPRLAAHLRAVHDVACNLTDLLNRDQPQLIFNSDSVRYGAATHDIGKITHLEELAGPGSAHEAAGHALLCGHGVPELFARFAHTHGTPTAADRTIEDLLVSLADKIWKGIRATDLETILVNHLATATGTEPWQAFLSLDTILDHLATEADARLGFQAAYPVSLERTGCISTLGVADHSWQAVPVTEQPR